MRKLELFLILTAVGLLLPPAPARALPAVATGDPIRAGPSPEIVKVSGRRRGHEENDLAPRARGFYFGPRLGFFRPPVDGRHGYRDWSPPVCFCTDPYPKGTARKAK
jgi:hypothetical protein